MDRNTGAFVLHVCSTLGVAFLGASLGAAALPPCTDGSVFGNLTSFYQAVLGDDDHDGTLDPGETPSAYYESMPQAMKDMVHCGADPARTVPDIVLYRQRPESLGGLVRDRAGRVSARVYDHLDPITGRFYVAVVLSGCYTDNVLGKASAHPSDAAYLSSVFWPGDHTHAANEDGARLVGGFRCDGAAGAVAYDYAPAGIELDLLSLAAGSASNDEPEAAAWITAIERPGGPGFPAAMAWRHGTSSWWNMEMRAALADPEVAAAMAPLGAHYWDVEDNSPPGGGDERPTDDDWKSPFDHQSNLFGELGWGSTWFSDRYLWEWQHVYELSFRANACSGTPDDWIVSWNAEHASSPSKPAIEICGLDANQATLTVIKDSVPADPWDKYDFLVSGPTPQGFRLQDPGSNECPGDPLCSSAENTGAWTHPDRVTSAGLIASPDLGGATYRVEELAPDSGFTVGWECKNVAASPPTSTCDPARATFDFDACPAVASTCAAPGSDWADGHISCRQTDPDFAACATDGVSARTDDFELCHGMRAICRFTNQGDHDNQETCLGTATAIGDLRVLGGAVSGVSFTAAAVPGSAAPGSDSIFLASFVPIADQSRWAGTVDHFIQPLPVIENADGNLVPDRSHVCADAEETSCLAWDAAAEILEQSPDASEVASDRRIGTSAAERRVTYTQAAVGDGVPLNVRAFDYSDSDARADEHDLWQGMGLPFLAGDASSEEAARSIARHAIRRTLAQRSVEVTDASTGDRVPLTYVLGDFFHADPVLVAGPSNFSYLANDVEGNGRACNATTRPNRGYRCFFEKERRRRRVLLAPSNDGQVHAFDAGFFRGSVEDGRLVGRFDAGTGREIFAHIPRPMLRHTRDLVALEHAPGIDGQLTVDDVFIDPAHSGTPAANDREWRTVAIGAYRDGGSGLYALDLTHPDPVQSRTVLSFTGEPDLEYVPVAASSAVPACTALERSLQSGCGRPYPMVLWEFADADLGLSWSKVNTGRVRVRLAGEHRASRPIRRGVRGRPRSRRPEPGPASLHGRRRDRQDVVEACRHRRGAERAGGGRHRSGRVHRHPLRGHRRRLPVQGRRGRARRRRRFDRPRGRRQRVVAVSPLRHRWPRDLLSPHRRLRREHRPLRDRVRHRRPVGPVVAVAARTRGPLLPDRRFGVRRRAGHDRGGAAHRVELRADRRRLRCERRELPRDSGRRQSARAGCSSSATTNGW